MRSLRLTWALRAQLEPLRCALAPDTRGRGVWLSGAAERKAFKPTPPQPPPLPCFDIALRAIWDGEGAGG